MKNELYWEYNLPLQIWPTRDDDKETSPEFPATQWRVLNYMPRRERCETIDLDDETLGEQTREEFLETAAETLELLAKQMRAAAADPNLHVYYPR